jgi:hypothetical protein
MVRNALGAAVFLVAAIVAQNANAKLVTVLHDGFNSEVVSLNHSFTTDTNWTVPKGSIDLIGKTTVGGKTKTLFDLYPGHGGYIDLDGTLQPGQVAATMPDGVLSSALIFKPGTYTLEFLLGGNQRETTKTTTTTVKGKKVTIVTVSDAVKTTLVKLGDFSHTFANVPYNQPLTDEKFTFTTKVAGHLTFQDTDKVDNIGNILDDVTLSRSVPELSTWAMMLVGFGMVGLAVRRRNAPGACAAA